MNDVHTQPVETVISASIRSNVRPSAVLASRMRELLFGIYGELLEPDEMYSVAMTAHELLENVTKYSADGQSTFEVEIFGRCSRNYVRLCTRNGCAPDDADRVGRLLARISSAPDPMTIYDDLVATSHLREGSGLGLARIRAEGEMSLLCSSDHAQITIVAERPVSIRTS
jgi:hypothetical protein